MTNKRNRSILLELINKRHAWDNPELRWVEPHYQPHEQIAIHDTLIAVAQANSSDPFAASRAALYIRNGLEDYRELNKIAKAQIGQRRHEGKHAPDGLEPLKKQIDEDRAWLAHNKAA